MDPKVVLAHFRYHRLQEVAYLPISLSTGRGTKILTLAFLGAALKVILVLVLENLLQIFNYIIVQISVEGKVSSWYTIAMLAISNSSGVQLPVHWHQHFNGQKWAKPTSWSILSLRERRIWWVPLESNSAESPRYSDSQNGKEVSFMARVEGPSQVTLLNTQSLSSFTCWN